MPNTLIVNFVDGSDVEINFVLNEKRIEITAQDEKTLKQYRLVFADCTVVTINFSDEDEPDFNNLCDGITELGKPTDKIRKFSIDFMDESTIVINCKKFEMHPVGAPNI